MMALNQRALTGWTVWVGVAKTFARGAARTVYRQAIVILKLLQAK